MSREAMDTILDHAIATEALVGVSYAVLRDGGVVASGCLGYADREAGLPLREDHIFRAFSNTKLITSICALQLHEQGRFRFDDPIGEHIPCLRDLRVMRAGGSMLDDTQALREPVRVRHLLTHTAGLTYGFLDPSAPIGKAYAEAGIADPTITLAEQMTRLSRLPLVFQPGTRWNYSVGTDVVGRLIEVLSGLSLDDYFRRYVFEPAGMTDTGFVVPPKDAGRLAALYVGDLQDPLKPGLTRADQLPYPGAYLQPLPRLNPGGGLVSTLGDFTRLVQLLLTGGAPLLKPESMHFLQENQLPAGMWIQFPGFPPIEGRGHSFAASVTVQQSNGDPTSRPGDVQWGGLAGTHWFFSPREGLGAVLMTQRFMGFGLPFWPKFKEAVRRSQGL